jgi:type III pantothenate kinase
MLLAIDIGNSDVVFGINENDQWIHVFRIESSYSRRSSDFEARLRLLFLENNLTSNAIKQVIISSVVPDLTPHIIELINHMFQLQPNMVGPNIYPKLGLEILRPYEIGTDLVANAVYGHQTYQSNCIIVDFGTALTFTVVLASGKIEGVSIAPGIRTAMKSLFTNTAQLPDVPMQVPDSVIGKDTVSAIQAGVMWGYIGMVEKMLSKIKEEIGQNTKVIATGGLSSILIPLHPQFDEVNVKVTLEGLKMIYRLIK